MVYYPAPQNKVTANCRTGTETSQTGFHQCQDLLKVHPATTAPKGAHCDKTPSGLTLQVIASSGPISLLTG